MNNNPWYCIIDNEGNPYMVGKTRKEAWHEATLRYGAGNVDSLIRILKKDGFKAIKVFLEMEEKLDAHIGIQTSSHREKAQTVQDDAAEQREIQSRAQTKVG